MIRTLSVLALGLMLTGAAQAAGSCYTTSAGSDLSWTGSIDGPFTPEERDTFDLMRLRQDGVDATKVERWAGCIRAYVRKADGGEEMQFFDPDTYQRVFNP